MNQETTESAIKWLSSKLSSGEEPIVYDPSKVRRTCGSATGLHTFQRMRNGDLYCVWCNLSIRKEE